MKKVARGLALVLVLAGLFPIGFAAPAPASPQAPSTLGLTDIVEAMAARGVEKVFVSEVHDQPGNTRVIGQALLGIGRLNQPFTFWRELNIKARPALEGGLLTDPAKRVNAAIWMYQALLPTHRFKSVDDLIAMDDFPEFYAGMRNARVTIKPMFFHDGTPYMRDFLDDRGLGVMSVGGNHAEAIYDTYYGGIAQLWAPGYLRPTSYKKLGRTAEGDLYGVFFRAIDARKSSILIRSGESWTLGGDFPRIATYEAYAQRGLLAVEVPIAAALNATVFITEDHLPWLRRAGKKAGWTLYCKGIVGCPDAARKHDDL
jgi:hypothetical protein